MGEECLNASKRRKIEDTVLQILQVSDLETTTESTVRSAAAERLGFALSGLPHRLLVRKLVDSFLLTAAAAVLRTTPLRRDDTGDNSDNRNAEQREIQQQQLQRSCVGDGNYRGKVICKLSAQRKVTIHDSNGTNMVAIREFFMKDGNMVPRKGMNSGVSLTPAQWSSFRDSFPSIEDAIVKLESRLRRRHAVHPLNDPNFRSEAPEKQGEPEKANSMDDSGVERNQDMAGICNTRIIVYPPTKRKQPESEADTTNSVAGSAAEKNQTQSGTSNMLNTHPITKIKQIEADTSMSLTACNSQEHCLGERKQEAAGTSASVATSCPQEHIPSQGRLHDTCSVDLPKRSIVEDGKQTEANISTSVPAFPTQGQQPHHTVNVSRPHRLIPIQTARLDGRNYHSWRLQMEFLLNQLNISYVLSELCPIMSLNPESSYEERVKVNAAVKKWIDDDYLCRHNILSSLCDNLFQLYSEKSYSARELWEELKRAYNEDFGTKRSQINKYIHFQMVDGVSILEQVQELHEIADSIMAYGSWIDENFHVSVIVSKLPPSWKDFRVRLMHEEFLTVNMLMHRLQVEEESRLKRATYHSKQGHVVDPKLDFGRGMRKKEYKKVCYSCGKEGHISNNCPDKNFEACEKRSEKTNGVLSPRTGTKMADAANKE